MAGCAWGENPRGRFETSQVAFARLPQGLCYAASPPLLIKPLRNLYGGVFWDDESLILYLLICCFSSDYWKFCTTQNENSKGIADKVFLFIIDVICLELSSQV